LLSQLQSLYIICHAVVRASTGALQLPLLLW
jgi:hypothetical protein